MLCARWGLWVGLVATGALFAVAHLVAHVHAPIALLNIFASGLVFGLLALNGEPVDPMSIKIEGGSTLAGAELAAFRKKRDRIHRLRVAQTG